MKLFKVLSVFLGLCILAGSTNLVVFFLRPGIVRRELELFEGGLAKVKSLLAAQPARAQSEIPFQFVEIDSIAGDVKMVGDIDDDGFPDLVIGGMPDEQLNWYRYPDWNKTAIAAPNNEFTTDGALGDVDGDGDLDIVTPDGDAGDNLVWFENPLPGGNPSVGSQWQRHTIGSIGSWGKDVHLADFDGNGDLDVATRSQSQVMIFFQTGENAWTRMEFSGLNTGSEGMASGDIDGDGDIDLVLQGVWVRNPGGSAGWTASNWSQFTIGDAHPDFKALVVDLDKDGVMDVVFSSSEGTADVNWWEPATGDPTGAWINHTVQASLDRAHTLQAADMDLDGDVDLVLGQMHTSSDKRIMVYLNDGGQALSWSVQVVGDTGLHNGVVADIGNDGDYDIYGANWTGNPPVKLWENRLDSAGNLNNWTYKQVSNAHSQTFGLAFGDLNNDNRSDIVSSSYWYANPGGDLLGAWQQNTFPAGMHAFLVIDVDQDSLADVIAQKDEADIALYWLEAQNADATGWNSVLIGTVPRASHEIGAQGYRSAQIEAGGEPEILISSGNGIYYFRVPVNPAAGNWPGIHVNSNPSDEGFAAGDIDGDGDLDIAGTTGDSKRVEWYENPGNGNAEWNAHILGTFDEALYPDRTELADLNGDARLDVIVTEENGEDQDAQTFWWAQPEDAKSSNWSRQLIVSQATTNSMDVADMNGDDFVDVILAEHRGSKKLAIWVNDGDGTFTEIVVDTGRESHLGARVVDLDGDGDSDIVSIAWDASNELHLWRNDNVGGVIPSPTPPQPTATPTPGPQPTPLPSGRVMGGLVAWYTFQEGSGGTVFDQSGLVPALDLNISNLSAVKWLQEGGLEILSPVFIATAEAPSRLIQACQASNEITLEAWVVPASTSMNGPARIISLSMDPYNRNFTLGQEFDVLDVRLRTTSTSENGMPSLASPSGSVETQLMNVVYVRESDGSVQMYKNGSLMTSGLVDGNFSNWSTGYRLALANEFEEDRHWQGTLRMVAIYCRGLTEGEVDQNYKAGPSGEASTGYFLPYALKKFEGILTTLPDETDNVSGEVAVDNLLTVNADLQSAETISPDHTIFVVVLMVGAGILGLLVFGWVIFRLYNKSSRLSS